MDYGVTIFPGCSLQTPRISFLPCIFFLRSHIHGISEVNGRWMSTLAPIVVPFMVSAQRDDTAKKCGSVHKLASTVLMTCAVVAIFDTCVFIAISLEVLMAYPAEGWKARIKVFLNKNQMGHLFRAVLQTGQLYYL